MNGVINFLKPVGMTSSDAVVVVKRMLHEKKVGHLGTLDPLASGVLPIAVGKCTRLFDFFLEKKKAYRAFFDFSYTTSSLDNAREIIERTDKIVSMEVVEEASKKLLGKQLQMPPIYSAKSINGVRAYDLAMAGKEVDLKPSEIEIFDIKVQRQYKENGFVLDIVCSSGTYIRSIVRDLGNILGTCGTMTALIRLKSGIFEIDKAVTLDELDEKSIMSPEEILNNINSITYELEEDIKNVINGVKIPVELEDGFYKIYIKDQFYALGTIENKVLKSVLRLND